MHQTRCLVVRFACTLRDPDDCCGNCYTRDSTAILSLVDTLSQDMEPIDWTTFHAWKTGRKAIPRDSFLLTFDDVLRKHTETVAPILETRGIKALFFVTTAPLVTGRLTSTHQFQTLLDLVETRQLEMAIGHWMDLNCPLDIWTEYERTYRDKDNHSHTENADYIRQWVLQMVPMEVRRRMIDDLFGVFLGSSRDHAQRTCLTMEDLADLQSRGHTVGSHGHLHESLSRMAPDQQRHDITRASRVLNETLGEALRPFSYPYGDFDESVTRICRDVGFAQGFTRREAWIRRGTDDFTLGRFEATSTERLAEKLLGCVSAV